LSRISPPLKYHGGKHYLAQQIVDMMPPHLHYSEPYAGGLSVLLAKDPDGVSESVNDLDGDLMNFWRVLRWPNAFHAFERAVQAIPFSEDMWNSSNIEDTALSCESETDDCVDCAVAFFIRCRQSLAGRGKIFAPLSTTRTRRGMNEQASAWLSAVEGLPAVHARLVRVAITTRSAIDCIRQQDGPETLFYLDPPYLHETRSKKGTEVYRFEMTDEDHRVLLDTLASIKGKFILSGYESKMYNHMGRSHGWRCTSIDVPNNAAGGEKKRRMQECLWTNYILVNEADGKAIENAPDKNAA
jgi:DNA adenine methylase